MPQLAEQAHCGTGGTCTVASILGALQAPCDCVHRHVLGQVIDQQSPQNTPQRDVLLQVMELEAMRKREEGNLKALQKEHQQLKKEQFKAAQALHALRQVCPLSPLRLTLHPRYSASAPASKSRSGSVCARWQHVICLDDSSACRSTQHCWLPAVLVNWYVVNAFTHLFLSNVAVALAG